MRKKTKKLGALILTFAMVLTSITLPQGKKASAAPSPEVEKYETDADATLPEAEWIDQLITGADMKEAGIDVAALQNKSVTITPIIQITKAHDRSFLRFTGGSYLWQEVVMTPEPGSTAEPDSTPESIMKFVSYGSNKGLIGIKHAGADGASSTKFVIHNGYGTGKEGTGVGAAGTGIYNKIPNINTSRFAGGGSVSNPDTDHVFVRLQIRTRDTEARIIGVIFGDGQSFSVDADGKCTAGFDESQYKYESDVPDETDVAPLTAKEKLEASLTTAKEVKQSDCIDEESYQALQAAITDAESVLDTADDETLSAKQAVLEQNIIAATSKNRMGLKSSIAYCSTLKSEDYTEDTYSRLQPAIEAATAAFNDTTKTDLEYKDARDNLEIVRTQLAKIPSTDPGKPKTFRVLTKDEVVKEMGAGTNLGNTFDGGLNNATETSWQPYRTTKEYIKALHDAGYNTVRVPVTWNGYINDDYTIKEEWISRVQEVVDYCIDQDMYCILNIHHDGAANHDNRGDNAICWLDTYAYDIESVYQKFEGVWNTIADRFKDYDEHLIFEGMNEVTDAHGTATNEDTKVLNCLNQLFVNTVRATGSNNAKRWLGITGRFATFSTGTTMPEDTLVADGIDTTRLMFAVHIYKDNTATRWSYDSLKTWESSLHSSVNNVAKLDSNMPIYVGEYGVRIQAQPGSETGYNNVERALNYEVCTAIAKYYNAVNVVWDQGAGDYNREEIETGLFTDWNRPALKPYFEDTVQGLIRGTYDSYTEENVLDIMAAIYKSYGHETVENNDVSKNPEIAEATTLTLDKTSVALTSGEWTEIKATTDSAKDIVLWSTDDDSIATVSQGKIRAKKMGITTIHAYTQSGSAKEDVQVVVASSGEETSTAIAVEKSSFELEVKDSAQIEATLTPADSQDEISYKSSNPEIASVSRTGRITALKSGSTYITVSAASGVTTIVKVVVLPNEESNQVDYTMNIFFGSGIEEKSQQVT
ncbi:MAG: cellulase family glycosylhydrolase [Lachnospiraceae bacterium]|nr:cellulase family glycosylhydrolase [Lachnospiraceae bacterium]